MKLTIYIIGKEILESMKLDIIGGSCRSQHETIDIGNSAGHNMK
jgi:hypothetical protein